MDNNETNTHELDQGEICGKCEGYGWIEVEEDGMSFSDDCPVCDGTGLLTPEGWDVR